MSKKAWPKITKIVLKTGGEVYRVDARIKRKGKRYQCQTKSEAQTLAEQLRIQRENEGTASLNLSAHDRAEAAEALDRLRPHGRTLVEAVNYFIRHAVKINKPGLLVKDLLDEIVQFKIADNVSLAYANTWKAQAKQIDKMFPHAKVVDLTTQQIDDQLRGLQVAQYTRNNRREYISMMFKHAVTRGYVSENPVLGAVKVKIAPRVPGILTVEQAKNLLDCAAEGSLSVPEDTVPAIALGLFAGLRPVSEVLRLDWKDIHFGDRLVDIAADRTKMAQRRFVMMEENLLEWLQPYARQRGPIVRWKAATYHQNIKMIALKAGIFDWPADCLRHSFATYYYALCSDAGKTAKQLGHTGFTTLFQHYCARVKPAEGIAFFAIRPGRESNVVPMLATA